MITVQCEGDLADFVCVGTVGPNLSAERVPFLPKSPLCMLCVCVGVCVCVCVCVYGVPFMCINLYISSKLEGSR